MDAVLGQEWDSGPKSVSQEHLSGFQPPRRDRTDFSQSAHASAEAGQKLGVRTAFAWGLMSNAYLESLLLEVFGTSALEQGADLNVTFLRPVYLGDTIIAHAKVHSIEDTVDQRRRLSLEAWCENQDGVRVTDGYATVVIS
jgi:acyl dehydratase